MNDNPRWKLAFKHYEESRFLEAYFEFKNDFEVTGDHKSLHNMAWMKRELGDFKEALEIIQTERHLLKLLRPESDEERLNICVNLYELCFLNHLLGNKNPAWAHFAEYEKLNFVAEDLCERGCFYRLKGDLLKDTNSMEALEAYQKSKEYFSRLKDSAATQEIEQRMISLQ